MTNCVVVTFPNRVLVDIERNRSRPRRNVYRVDAFLVAMATGPIRGDASRRANKCNGAACKSKDLNTQPINKYIITHDCICGWLEKEIWIWLATRSAFNYGHFNIYNLFVWYGKEYISQEEKRPISILKSDRRTVRTAS